ncbi:glycoside hydrolase family 3 protein [Epidermidibacterium keratini]|uniref:beta-N-acetylhexosaminidase n=1 Tax=Epidermidibacterium keratini TaxID=1891644 RepID=A0A7L4YT94_9ACTN|nr:glycoside hydrolase family 3 protein [Epidermidibacterium keratini]
MSPQQKAAQLIMVAQQPNTGDAVTSAISDGDAGAVILLGKWQGNDAVSAAVKDIDALSSATAGIGIWVATDQEGGQVQKLKGSGFSTMPSALEQAAMSPDELTAEATTWAKELAAAGVDVNLAPVADVVPTSIGTANAPIGQYDRQYGATAAAVSPPMLAFAAGMTAGGVLPTAKHFPGIGRITGNTDETAVGIDDPAMTASDPDLAPFADAIAAQIPLVMISSARYPQLDPNAAALFSEPIITGLLRQQMGFGGIVISDDVGSAAAVADVPVPERATRFVAAGGDIVLTAEPSQAPQMNDALVAAASADAAFAAKLDAAVGRVLTQKDAGGLLPCSG